MAYVEDRKAGTLRGQAIGLALLLTILVGCRTPWSPMGGPEPNFDRLIQIEQQEKQQGASLTYDDESLVPPGNFDEVPVGGTLLDDDPEFASAYEQSSPEDRALLDRVRQRFGNNIAKRPGSPTDRLASKPSAADLTVDANEDETSFSLSDMRKIVPSKLDADTRRETENRLSTNVGRRSGSQMLADKTRAKTPEQDGDQVVTASSEGKRRSVEDVITADFENAHGIPAGSGEENLATDDMQYYSGKGDPKSGEAMTIRQHGHAIIDLLDKQIEDTSNPDERILLSRNRRMISFVLGDLDAAQAPIDGLAKETQSYFQNLLQGLYDATDINGNPVASRRLTLALQSHRRAEEELSKLAHLEVKNPSFCTEVDSFGVVTPFADYRFQAEQEVLLYCELENFVSRKLKNGFETQLQGSYEIVDRDGQQIMEQLLPEDTDLCGNQRSDFYIAYRLHMPTEIAPGQYKLNLIIEDMTGHKFGQSSLDFHIVQ